MEKYYVYIYLNPLKKGCLTFSGLTFDYQPFYVGKGCGIRDKAHLFPSSLSKKSLKNNTIKKIIKETGEIPIHIRLFENLSNENAIKIESEIINTFGRLENKSGILTNMTDGGEGVNNFINKNRDRLELRKKIYQYNLSGEFIREWESISSVALDCKQPLNIPTVVKRGTCWCNSLWSYTKVDKMKSRRKNEKKCIYNNISQLDKETDEIIDTFDNALDIEKKLVLHSGARNKIYDCLRGIIKTAYGYKWKIINNGK